MFYFYNTLHKIDGFNQNCHLCVVCVLSSLQRVSPITVALPGHLKHVSLQSLTQENFTVHTKWLDIVDESVLTNQTGSRPVFEMDLEEEYWYLCRHVNHKYQVAHEPTIEEDGHSYNAHIVAKKFPHFVFHIITYVSNKDNDKFYFYRGHCPTCM